MTLTIGIKNFRCFANVEDVRIAPITFLIGENSTGKTSFLAALRRALYSFSYNSGDPFNGEPYFLGSFEQIAHFRGGRSGRAKEFTLDVRMFPNGFTGLELENFKDVGYELSLTYGKGRLRSECVAYKFRFKDISVEVDLRGGKSLLTISREGAEPLRLDDKYISSFPIRGDAYFLQFVLDQIRVESRSNNSLNEIQRKLISDLVSAFRKCQGQFPRSIYASAPVRIQPRRVYTPSELTSTTGGEQIPLEMANQKLLSPAKWKAAKDKMVEFGSRSGLFEDIEIKRFGRSDGDPFQLQIKNHGPAANIVDVGYGVSQAIPLLYPLQNKGQYDTFLLQQPEVHLHPRAQAEFGSLIVDLWKDNPSGYYVVETHSDFILDRVRSEIKRGVIRHEQVSILYFKRFGLDVKIFEIKLNEDGDIIGYPEKYRDFFLEEQARILGI